MEILKNQLTVARNEMKNLRQQLICLRKKHDEDVKSIVDLLERSSTTTVYEKTTSAPKTQLDGLGESFTFRPVGHIESMFKQKNGTPRQAGVCPNASASLAISHNIFSNPEHSLQGLESFSHIWILFVFHKNNCQYTGAKIKPPRLDGAKVGLYATRCPYRPNPIGLTLAKIDRIAGNVIHLLGIDLLDGTPILDIKPYIPQYDYPAKPLSSLPVHSLDSERNSVTKHVQDEALPKISDASDSNTILTYCKTMCTDKPETVDEPDFKKLSSASNTCLEDSCADSNLQLASTVNTESDSSETSVVSYADWVSNPPASALRVTFTPSAEAQLLQFKKLPENSAFHVRRLPDASQLRSAIVDILSADPRSAYRRKHCTDRLYYLTVDTAHVTCWFDGHVVEVLKIQASG